MEPTLDFQNPENSQKEKAIYLYEDKEHMFSSIICYYLLAIVLQFCAYNRVETYPWNPCKLKGCPWIQPETKIPLIFLNITPDISYFNCVRNSTFFWLSFHAYIVLFSHLYRYTKIKLLKSVILLKIYKILSIISSKSPNFTLKKSPNKSIKFFDKFWATMFYKHKINFKINNMI